MSFSVLYLKLELCVAPVEFVHPVVTAPVYLIYPTCPASKPPPVPPQTVTF